MKKVLLKIYDCLLILATVLTVICVIITPPENMKILMTIPVWAWLFLISGKHIMNLITNKVEEEKDEQDY